MQFFLSYSANIRASLEVFGVCVTCCMARLLAKMANQLRITLACDVANLQREHAKKPGGSRCLQSAAVPSWEPDTRAICAVSVRYDEASSRVSDHCIIGKSCHVRTSCLASARARQLAPPLLRRVCLCVLQCVCFCVRGINELIHLEGRRCARARVCNADVDVLPTSDVTLA